MGEAKGRMQSQAFFLKICIADQKRDQHLINTPIYNHHQTINGGEMMQETVLNDQQIKDCDESSWDFSDLKALFINCTLKKTPGLSHTEGLIRISRAIMERTGLLSR